MLGVLDHSRHVEGHLFLENCHWSIERDVFDFYKFIRAETLLQHLLHVLVITSLFYQKPVDVGRRAHCPVHDVSLNVSDDIGKENHGRSVLHGPHALENFFFVPLQIMQNACHGFLEHDCGSVLLELFDVVDLFHVP